MTVRIQYRFFFKLLACVAIAGLVLLGIHRWQIFRNSVQFLEQARKSAESGNQADAIRLYTRYLGLSRNSAEAQFELADLFAKQGNFNSAFLYLESALRIDPSLQEARALLVKVAMGLERYADAKTNLSSELIPKDPENVEYQWLLGRCEIKLGELNAALEHLTRAVELDKIKPIYAATLAELLSDRMNRANDGRNVLNSLVAQAPSDPEAFLVRGRWLLKQSRMLAGDNKLRDELLDGAWQDAKNANRLAPNVPVNVMFLVEVAVATKQSNEVREAVQAAIKAHPGFSDLYASAAQIELSAKQPEAAIQFLKDGLKAIPGSPLLLFSLAQLELDVGEIEAGETLIAELRSREFKEAPIRLLESRVLAARGQWRQAATLLEQSRSLFDRSKDILRQADMLLSICYRNLGNPDQQMEALRRAISADPLLEPAREALADALLRSGRIQEAKSEILPIVEQPQPSASSVLSLARLEFVDGLGRNASGKDWTSLRRVLDILDTIPEAADDTAILRAELAVVENNAAEAEAFLKTRLATSPTSTSVHQALISLQIRKEAWDEVERSLDEAQKNISDTVTVRLERARYLIRRYGVKVDAQELERLSIPEANWDESQKVQLANGFANFFLSLKDYERGKKYASLVAESELSKSNLSIHLLMFELAFLSSDMTDMNKWLAKVKQIEGQGTLWRVGEAMRLMVEATKLGESAKDQVGDRDALYAKAVEQLAEAATERPNWPRIPRLKGEIFDRQKRPDLAVQSYLEAIRLGEQNPQLVARTISLLFDEGRFTEADEMVRKLQEQKSPFSSELTRMASQISLELENFDRALNLANDWAAKSGKQEDHVLLAQIHSVSRNYDKAEAEFRIAISKDRTAPGPWVSLVQMFSRIGKVDAATKLIEEASQEIRSEDRNDALAQAYQAIEDLEKASLYYQKALENRSGDVTLMRRYADFCLRTEQQVKAQPILETLISEKSNANEEEQSWARRSLAFIFGTGGSDEMVQKARNLLDINIQKNGQNIDDQRMLALILATRTDKPSRAEAVSLLQQIAKQERKFSLTDNYLLADLYRRNGDWTAYSRTMRSVLSNGGADDSNYVRSYAEALVQKGELIEAKLWFDRLKLLAPKDLSTATIEAQLFFRSKDYARLLKLLESKRDTPETLAWAAQVAESAGNQLFRQKETEAKPLLEMARSCYAQIAKSDPDHPLALGAYHARRGEIRQALELVNGESVATNEAGNLIQSALASGVLTNDEVRELISFGQAVHAKDPKNVLILMGLGDLWSWIGNGEEAVNAYQSALQIDPNNVPVLNNFAILLAFTGQQLSAATQAIEHAISLAGPTDVLLDTRGVVRFASANLEGAEQDFRKCIAISPRADRFFHLAQVLKQQKRTEDAKEALQKSLEGGVTSEKLHPLERKAFESLVKWR